MAIFPAVLVLLAMGSAALVVLSIIIVAVSLGVRSRAPIPAGAEFQRARRTSSLIIAAAIGFTVLAMPTALVGSMVAGAAMTGNEIAVPAPLVLGPLVLAGVYALVSLIGEFTWQRPAGSVRVASLSPQASGAVLPRRVLIGTATAIGALVLSALALAALTPDSQVVITAASGEMTIFPNALPGPLLGWRYGIAILTLTAVAAGLTSAALARIITRPAAYGVSAEEDAELRTRNAAAVLRGVGSMIVLALVSALTVVGWGLWQAAAAIDASSWERGGQMIVMLAVAILAGWGVAAFGRTHHDPVLIAAGGTSGQDVCAGDASADDVSSADATADHRS